MTTQPTFQDGQWIDPPDLIDTVVDGRPKLQAVSKLSRRVGWHDDEDETCNWVEYRENGVLVHRSAHMHLKKAMFAADGLAANFA